MASSQYPDIIYQSSAIYRHLSESEDSYLASMRPLESRILYAIYF